MCQLSYVDLGVKILNQLYVPLLCHVNTLSDHKDGTGIFVPGKGIFKTKISGDTFTVTNLFQNIESSPTILHVRKATIPPTGTGKIVSDELAHPFESERWVLAHNGSLEFINEKSNKDPKYNGMIDSQMFLHRLQEITDKHKKKDRLETILPKAMGEFCGKFAFLIYDKVTKLFYAVRGNTAELGWSQFFDPSVNTGKSIEIPCGLIVNTTAASLQSSKAVFLKLAISLGYNLGYSNDVEFQRESIYILSRDYIVEKVGEIKENIRAAVEANNYRNFPLVRGMTGHHHTGETNYCEINLHNKDSKITAKGFISLLDDSGLSLRDLMAISVICFSKNMFSLSLDEMEALSKILSTLKSRSSFQLREINRNIVKVATGAVTTIPIEIYKKYGLNFPFMLNSPTVLKSVYKSEKTIKETSKGTTK